MNNWKYKVIEYETKSLVYEDGKIHEELAKYYHKTNSWLIYKFICLILKCEGIKYTTFERGDHKKKK